jgi:hypothetical protein
MRLIGGFKASTVERKHASGAMVDDKTREGLHHRQISLPLGSAGTEPLAPLEDKMEPDE